jgi:deoxyribodipyrimidine photo-lyase
LTEPVICLFSQDLRLDDHPALCAAVASGHPVIPLYVLDESADWAPGGAGRWWLHYSLVALADALAAKGSRLILRQGDHAATIAAFAREVGASAIYFSRRYEPRAALAQEQLKNALIADGITCHRFGGTLLFEPESVFTGAGGPFKVFTPFYRACLAGPPPPAPIPAPDRIPAPGTWPASDAVEGWRLKPSKPDWSGGLRSAWRPGEKAAGERLADFLAGGAAEYPQQRDRPDRDGTSRLSPHLHFGEISPRRIWQMANFAADAGGRAGIDGFLRQLAWREFCHHLLHHFPQIDRAPFRPELASFPWRDDPQALALWQKGRTGYPIVDAGMRQLWQTGWMHNRVRMIAASFLVKDMLIPWQRGAEWFWDTLVDADLANNAAGWQWVAGSGADAAPYFRIFNPVLQGSRFDPDGVYIRHWLPELAALPADAIHAPWQADDATLAAAKVRLGETYPHPMVDHGKARDRALAALKTIKKGEG